jgi:hypothetical protein
MEYIRTVFLPNLNELRTLEEFAEEDAVLFMDNGRSHVGEDILNLLRDSRVRIITWAPQTTHLFQQLDICLFGILKRKEQYPLPFDNDETTSDFLQNIYQTFRQTMIEPNIWGVSPEAGFEFDTGAEPYRLVFHEEKLRKTPGFQESGHSISLSRNCRQDVKAQSLDGLTNLSKHE